MRLWRLTPLSVADTPVRHIPAAAARILLQNSGQLQHPCMRDDQLLVEPQAKVLSQQFLI